MRQRMGTAVPEDVWSANATLDQDMAMLNTAFQRGERAEVENAAKALDPHVVVVAEWLKDQGSPGRGR